MPRRPPTEDIGVSCIVGIRQADLSDYMVWPCRQSEDMKYTIRSQVVREVFAQFNDVHPVLFRAGRGSDPEGAKVISTHGEKQIAVLWTREHDVGRLPSCSDQAYRVFSPNVLTNVTQTQIYQSEYCRRAVAFVFIKRWTKLTPAPVPASPELRSPILGAQERECVVRAACNLLNCDDVVWYASLRVAGEGARGEMVCIFGVASRELAAGIRAS